MIVVPIPEVSASVEARSCTRRFASWIDHVCLATEPGARLLERARSERRGDLARAGAAHAVRDR